MQKSEKAWSKTIENKREKGQNHNYKDHSEYEKPALKPVFGFVSSGLLQCNMADCPEDQLLALRILKSHCKVTNNSTLCLRWLSTDENIRRLNPAHLVTRPDLPVTSSRTSLSVVFLRRRRRAGTPPQFLSATLLLSVALPYTRFLRAPQALFWTSATLWSSWSTRCWIPPRWHTCRSWPITETDISTDTIYSFIL